MRIWEEVNPQLHRLVGYRPDEYNTLPIGTLQEAVKLIDYAAELFDQDSFIRDIRDKMLFAMVDPARSSSSSSSAASGAATVSVSSSSATTNPTQATSPKKRNQMKLQFYFKKSAPVGPPAGPAPVGPRRA